MHLCTELQNACRKTDRTKKKDRYVLLNPLVTCILVLVMKVLLLLFFVIWGHSLLRNNQNSVVSVVECLF